MISQKEIKLSHHDRGFHIITDEILSHLGELPQMGMLNLFIHHTSAGLSVNENYDSTVLEDFESVFNRLVRENEPYYKHTVEGPDDMPSHIKSTLVGSSVTIPITNGKLNLGRWQGIYLCEFRNGGRERNLIATIYY